MMSIATRAADRRLARLPCNRRLLTRRGALAIAMSVGAVPLDSPAHIAQEKHEWVAIRLASRLTAACCILLACVVPATSTDAAQRTLEQPTLVWMQAVLNNWEAVCRRDLRIAAEPLPWIIFYDDNVAWHLQPEKRWLPPHEVSPHPLRFMGETYPLSRVAHQDGKLWVPDREPLLVDVAKPQIAAMPYDDQRKAFFVAPLPGLFHKLAKPDQARNLDELFLGTVAHELTHTRHYAHAMPQITRLRLRYKLPESFDDNIIQQEFGVNDEYKKLYDAERTLLAKAILARDLDDCRQAVGEALLASQKRKDRFFVGDKEGYSRLEDIFLAMEGLAMWVQYRTARERAPAGEEWLKTLITLSERHDAWSQEQGLGLFLLIDRLVPGWQARFLAPDFPSPFTVLREAVGRHTPLDRRSKPRRKRDKGRECSTRRRAKQRTLRIRTSAAKSLYCS